VYAVTGTGTVSFAIDASPDTKAGLLGFAVRRFDLTEDPDPRAGDGRWMDGFKVFPSDYPEPTTHLRVSTYDQPVQSFSWDDFTVRPDHRYRYEFHPVKGAPGARRRPGPWLTLTVRTEALYGGTHDVFFNRGVAGSQAYERQFGTGPIDSLSPERRAQAIGWLSRDLDDAMLRFIATAQPGERILGCFYEFRYEPVVQALKDAIDAGVDVQLVVDAKVNQHYGTDHGKRVFFPSFPRLDNKEMVEAVGIPEERVHWREARRSAIAHNKFMVRVAADGAPQEVWTGSTNLSEGGIAGQTNVGHWVRDPSVAAAFQSYWGLLAGDPGGRYDDTRSTVIARNAAFRDAVEALSPVPADLRAVDPGSTPVFSPRRTTTALTSYAALLDSATRLGCITFAFGVGAAFKEVLRDNTSDNALVFMLLEKRDRPDPRHPTAYVRINARNNVYEAWGSYLDSPVYQWARETNAGRLGLNQHVSYVHSKFMLVDPLGEDPIVVTGSANFSEASTTENDENMLLIRGDRRAADIYLTEFNRIFNHYYFRSITEISGPESDSALADSLFLAETDAWQEKYAAGRLKAKRLALYSAMRGFSRA